MVKMFTKSPKVASGNRWLSRGKGVDQQCPGGLDSGGNKKAALFDWATLLWNRGQVAGTYHNLLLSELLQLPAQAWAGVIRSAG